MNYTDITFRTDALVTYGIQAVLMALLVLALVLVWRKRTGEPFKPVIVGAIIFPVFALGLENIPKILLMLDNPISKSIAGNPWALYPICAVLAGVFEETGRYVAFRFFLKKENGRRTAISYGIGHGGIEVLIVGVGTAVTYIVYGILFNTGNAGALFEGQSEENIAMILDQIRPLAESGMGQNILTMVLALVERIVAVAFHVGVSVLVFAAVKEQKHRMLFPLAIFLHAVFDFVCTFYATGTLPLYVVELILAAIAVGLGTVVYRFYKTLQE